MERTWRRPIGACVKPLQHLLAALILQVCTDPPLPPLPPVGTAETAIAMVRKVAIVEECISKKFGLDGNLKVGVCALDDILDGSLVVLMKEEKYLENLMPSYRH